jgi:hypothetical protein
MVTSAVTQTDNWLGRRATVLRGVKDLAATHFGIHGGAPEPE